MPPDKSSQISKGKQREDSPQTTDIADKLIAYKRRTAVQSRPRDKVERMPPAATTAVVEKNSRPTPSGSRSPKKLHAPPATTHRPAPDADADEFSRKLQISSSTSSSPSRSVPSGPRQNPSLKLYNPDRDPIPTMRRTAEPDSMSDTDSSHAPRYKRSPERDAPTRQLFDHRKDDPVRFAVLARPQQKQRPTPTPKSSGEYISASSTSSYAASQISSTFTLSSTTDGSSASSAIFDQSRPNTSSEDGSTNVFANQLKRLYRNITSLETKIKDEDAETEEDSRYSGRILRKGKDLTQEDEEAEKEKWKKRFEDHQRLAEYIHNMLEISLSPSVPASLRSIPTKYNIIMRLWVTGFNKLLQSLQRACLESPVAMEYLQAFIYYAYTFYTGLYEEQPLSTFKPNWLEALGDLARYRMAVAAITAGSSGDGPALTAANISEAAAHSTTDSDKLTDSDAKSVSDAPAARIDDSPSPSVGIAAARALELLPEKEQWRVIARDWYGTGIIDQPGTGKLHHHLGLLYREVESEELRAVYHFVKSMVSLHPFPNSRENVLPIWSPEAQARRQLPDARVSELFVLLHGMLYTNIQLDDFNPTFSRFMERLELEGAQEREWIMMAIVNIGSLYEYGKANGVLKKAAPTSSSSAQVVSRIAKKEAQQDDSSMDIDDESMSPHMTEASANPDELPRPFVLSLELTSAMLKYVLRHPSRKPSPFSRSRINPYLTVILTFLLALLKQPKLKEIIERGLPWEELTTLFSTIPRNIMTSQGLFESAQGERWTMLTSNTAPPLPEDWCMRGMEWVGRKVFQPGYWKLNEERRAEIETLGEVERVDITDGHIEDDDRTDSSVMSETAKRWVRIVRCAVGIAGIVDGFTWVECTREWKVEGVLLNKVKQWREEEQLKRNEEERRRTHRADDSMDVDEENVDTISDDSDEDNEDDSDEIRVLKERRRYLRSLLQSGTATVPVSTSRRFPRSSREDPPHTLLPIMPGYTVLVIDTNILLSSLSMFASLVESNRWTIMVPLPVVMELDGLKTNSTDLGRAATAALDYVTSHIRSHSLSLKIQTSKGNYLANLNVRTEQVDFSMDNAERSMDDLILKAAFWHQEHWVDRSALLNAEALAGIDPVKVVLLSLDRNRESNNFDEPKLLILIFAFLQFVSRLAHENYPLPAKRTLPLYLQMAPEGPRDDSDPFVSFSCVSIDDMPLSVDGRRIVIFLRCPNSAARSESDRCMNNRGP
ncbi:hypothetical protein GYMLUDRAFT_651182 [Collybiopsis luxurians FD-317 M1]|uniref:Unplaced genomic scaffold GYMLUscaffold_30, whole genome shotgun sequence n=1 Tax=Collybiopsis luxurians FD-317 M1 TaxID=944289 RepID=A0A0D0CM56_9AGAR|nr:hypothetical protein GYMLUDRAFT_651182 [Collybiopsis luxurians FD-317 M1]